jgi:hypothetical protein
MIGYGKGTTAYTILTEDRRIIVSRDVYFGEETKLRMYAEPIVEQGIPEEQELDEHSRREETEDVEKKIGGDEAEVEPREAQKDDEPVREMQRRGRS